MRKPYALVVLLISVASIAAVSVTGQEEPLPAVTPKANPAIASDLPPVVLVVEPIRELRQPTLAEAARRNDFITFDALYREAKLRGESVAEFETLHELWTYAITDPIGAFYGAEIHDRLAASYPGYAKYIDDYKIIDDRGNVFYPTSETRSFLLDRALEKRAPRVLIANSEEREPLPEVKPKAKPVPAARIAVPTPVVASLPEAAGSQPVDEAPPTESPALQEAPAAKPAVVLQAQPQARPQSIATPQPVPQQLPAVRDNAFASRGVLLLVIGLIGIGLLALMLRTPSEAPQLSVLGTQPDEKPAAPVEPIRRPAAPSQDEPRATGSHG